MYIKSEYQNPSSMIFLSPTNIACIKEYREVFLAWLAHSNNMSFLVNLTVSYTSRGKKTKSLRGFLQPTRTSKSKKLQTFRKSPNQTIRFKFFFSLFDLKSQIEFRILPTSKMMANNISESLKGKKRPREADIDAPTGDFDQIPRLGISSQFS